MAVNVGRSEVQVVFDGVLTNEAAITKQLTEAGYPPKVPVNSTAASDL